MEVGNQLVKHLRMDTTYPIKKMKFKNSQTKFLKKIHISMHAQDFTKTNTRSMVMGDRKFDKC